LIGDHAALLDLLPRAAFQLAEQLCGKETLIYPTGGGDTPFAHPGANHAAFHIPGAPITRPGHACRGVYCSLPPLDTPQAAAAWGGHRRTFHGHVDGWEGQRWRLSASTLLQDVGPGGGGFCVWPGSHRATWGLHMGLEGGDKKTAGDSARGAALGDDYYDEFNATVQHINDTQASFEVSRGP
jgi:hypothetical protein